ncbi:MAG: PTS sugar transporter subunit IIB [Erysipelotrichaceae bacterium]|nr:PTS sugar transporter subunit IIB [Erysipelotrichaceae bacterium]
MKINLCRVDERLIHGQVMTAWVKKCWIKKIILVDDELASDDFMKEVLALSAPSGVKVEVRSVEDTLQTINSSDSDESTLLLFKEVKFAYELYKVGYDLKELNIGNIGSSPIRKAITNQVYMSEDEKAMCRELNEKGVYVYIQKLPQDSQVDVMTKI